MTIMKVQTPEQAKRPFWYYLEGPKSGIQHYVKNLGWLMNHASHVREIHVSRSIGGTAHLTASLGDRNYYCPLNSFTIANDFANRRAFKNAHKIIME